MVRPTAFVVPAARATPRRSRAAFCAAFVPRAPLITPRAPARAQHKPATCRGTPPAADDDAALATEVSSASQTIDADGTDTLLSDGDGADPDTLQSEENEVVMSDGNEVFADPASEKGGDGSGDDPGGGGGGGGDYGSSGEGGGSENSESGPSLLYVTAERAREVQGVVGRKLAHVGRATGGAYHYFIGYAGKLLHVVPAPVLVALISLVSTVSGARYKAALDVESAKKAEMAAARRRKDEIERTLRKTYQELAAPILRSAAKLAERIQVLVELEWSRVEKADVKENLSPAYSAYLLGRYLATVEIIKRERALLDYGFPAADRILANILGRVQGVLCANDELLIEMQKTEHLFQPGPGQKPLRGGPLRITPRAQTVLGELLLRKLWRHKYEFIDQVEVEELKRGQKAVLSFLEFSRVLQDDATMAHWYQPVVDEFRELENTVHRLPQHKRRCDAVGSRLHFLQAGLLDLVEFFDPLPHAQAIPFYRRRRLRLGRMRHSEEQRSPLSLHLLYRELANIRDHRVVGGDQMERLKLPGGKVEVHVKASPSLGPGDASVLTTKHGDCPYSQRVLIVLEELGIPYKTVYVSAHAKPAWFYLLHPENRTPVVYHNGNLVEDSKHIVSYLMERFPQAPGQLNSADNLRLAVGTAVFTRFHRRFVNWVSGNMAAREELERELRTLDATLARAQAINSGQPFFGGDRFSREDTAVAPMLNNVAVAGQALMRWKIPGDCKALRKYLDAAREVPSFNKTVGDDEAIVAGYGRLGISGGERTWRLADMLE